MGLLAGAGCSSMQTTDIGYARSLVTERQQLMLRGRSTTGDEHLLTGFDVRARVGPTAQQIGAGFAMIYQPLRIGTRMIPHVGGGAMALELGRVDDDFEIGVSEPWLELGMTWMIENDVGLKKCDFFQVWGVVPGLREERKKLKQEGWGLTLTSGALLDIRFTGQPTEVMWVAALGVSEVVRIGPCE
jgi:hypothetical protein